MSEEFSLPKLINAVENNNLPFIQSWLDSLTNGFNDHHYILILLALNHNTGISKLLIDSGCPVESKIGTLGKLLQKAVRNDDIEITTKLLAKKKSNDTSEKDYTSPLLYTAIKNRSLDMVKFLLNNNADLNYANESGMTVLQGFFEKLFRGNGTNPIDDERVIEIIMFLVSQVATLNFRSLNGLTTLHYAVIFGQKDLLHAILEKTVNVNTISLANETPLHLLLLRSDNNEENIIETVNLFILKGVRGDIPNSYNETACHIAAKKKYIKVLHSLFLQCQCDINFCDVECCTVLHRIFEDSIILNGNEDFNKLVNLMILREPFCNIKNQNGKTPLHIATENKHYEILYNMLFRVENLNVPDNEGDTVLHIFLRNIDKNFDSDAGMDIVKTMLTRGANIDVANKIRQTPLHLALELKNMKLLPLVLEYSNDLNNIYTNLGWSILHIFSTTKCTTEQNYTEMSQIAEMCIKRGAIVDLQDVSCQTPLALAVSNKNIAMVKVLLQYGANANARFKRDRAMMHNLLIINSEVDVEIAEMLLAHGMDVDKACYFIELTDFVTKGDLYMTLLKHMKDMTKYNIFGKTMLHSVLQNNKYVNKAEEVRLSKFVSMLLSKGTPIDAKTTGQKTALHLAVENKHNVVIKILLQNGADPLCLSDNNNSVLHLISMQTGYTGVEEEIIDTLIEKVGSQKNNRNAFGFTPFLLAAKNGLFTDVRVYIKHKVNVHCTVGEFSDSALHLAASENHSFIIRLIVDSGLSVHTQRKDGKTALHLAAAILQYGVIRALLDNGIDVNMKDNEGRTALHVACWNNSLDNVSCLLEYGADLNFVDKFQIVPLMLAQNFDGVIQKKLIYHIKKLEMVELYVSPLNREVKQTIQIPEGEMIAFLEEVFKEIVNMSDIFIDKKVPLLNVLQMNTTRLWALNNDKIFQQHINTGFLKLKFPHLADLITGCYRKGVIRHNFLTLGTMSLKRLLGFELPKICTEKMLDYLSNEDLQKLAIAARLALKKRKRIFRMVCNVNKRARCVPL